MASPRAVPVLAMDSWHSYPKSFALGHRAIRDLFAESVIVEEKIDGSQFSFGRFGDDLLIRSKGCVMNIDAPEKMFNVAAATVKELGPRLVDGWTYRGEYLAKPKHNALAYDRVPTKHVIIFDINKGNEHYLPYEEKRRAAAELGLETVHLLYEGIVPDIGFFRSFLDKTSILGGQKIEGVVVKNYARYTVDGKAMMGKFVSEAFKEVHGASWKETNPGKADIIEKIIERVRTPARWAKAVQHLREAGALTDTPKDISPILKEVQKDIAAECGDDISSHLMAWAMPQINRGSIRGLPEWYKEQLMRLQFEGDSVASPEA